jgi:hypothetical protein
MHNPPGVRVASRAHLDTCGRKGVEVKRAEAIELLDLVKRARATARELVLSRYAGEAAAHDDAAWLAVVQWVHDHRENEEPPKPPPSPPPLPKTITPAIPPGTPPDANPTS